ncbi:MAG TPA: ABC transporter permease, partial [Burkholderiales bacterium]|nr:ABC transporter permease [Burkholderiales bacterium]
MFPYVVRRVFLVVPTLVLAALLVFLLIRAVPGDPALLFVGDVDNQAAVAEKRAELGLDRSLPEQFALWVKRAAAGDLGRSIKSDRPVSEEIAEAFPVSFQIVLLATVVAVLIAVPAGMFAAWKQNSAADFTVVAFTTLCLSVPSFWVALMMLLFFGVNLGWLPTVGYVSIAESFSEGILYLLMPVAALVLTEMATITRMTRSSTIEVLRLEYITHARAKGATEAAVLWRHAFPNAFAPTLTIIGLILGHLLGGVVVIETMFSLPGMGRLMVGAILARDYPVVQGVLLLVVLLYVVVNFAVDLLYPAFDPRVK